MSQCAADWQETTKVRRDTLTTRDVKKLLSLLKMNYKYMRSSADHFSIEVRNNFTAALNSAAHQ
jgi:hypothetical protein